MKLPDPDAAERFAEGLASGIHPAPPILSAGSLQEALEACGLATFVVDLRGADGKAGILRAIATDLHFPGWVGRNWDALEDAMRDLSWLPTGTQGRAILLLGAEQPSAGSSEELEVLEDVLESAVASWAGTDTPLIVVTAD